MFIREDPLPCIVDDDGTCLYVCKTCGRLFYNQEAYDQHVTMHKDNIKKWHCKHCNKVFKRDAYKLLHERNCQHGAGPSRKRPLAQQTLEEYVIKKVKGIESEQLVQQGGSNEHPEYWRAPELLESTLKYTAMTYRKSFDDSNRIDLLDRLKTALEHFKPIVRGMVSATKDAIKWYLSLNLHFVKAADVTHKTDPSVTFRSEVFNSITDDDLDAMFAAGYHQLVQQIDEFQHNGSGWVVDSFLSTDLGRISSYLSIKFNMQWLRNDLFLDVLILFLFFISGGPLFF